MRIIGRDNGLLVVQMEDHSQVKMTDAEWAAQSKGAKPDVERKDVVAPEPVKAKAKGKK